MDNVNVDDFLAAYGKDKRVKRVTIVRENASTETTDNYLNEEYIGIRELKARIKKAETEIKQGKGLNKAQMLAKHEEWKKKHGLTK